MCLLKWVSKATPCVHLFDRCVVFEWKFCVLVCLIDQCVVFQWKLSVCVLIDQCVVLQQGGSPTHPASPE